MSPKCFWLSKYTQTGQWGILTDLCPISPVYNWPFHQIVFIVLAFRVLRRTFSNSCIMSSINIFKNGYTRFYLFCYCLFKTTECYLMCLWQLMGEGRVSFWKCMLIFHINHYGNNYFLLALYTMKLPSPGI